jgi:DNA-binding HxlR family transcriptional regulator
MVKRLACPAEATLRLVSGRWKLMVIFWLLEGELRFNELQRRLGGITHRTLAKQLREMEADGLVERRDYGEIPPRVDYRLTTLGGSLRPILQAMDEWAARHHSMTSKNPSLRAKRIHDASQATVHTGLLHPLGGFAVTVGGLFEAPTRR